MNQQARMLSVTLEEPVFSLLDICRQAKVWPSTAKYFLSLLCENKRIRMAGETLPDRRGIRHPLYVVADNHSREILTGDHKMAGARSYDSLIEEDAENLLEPPIVFRAVIATAMLRRDTPIAEQRVRASEAKCQFLEACARSPEIYDDTGRGELVYACYRRLALLCVHLAETETGTAGGCSVGALRHGFEEVAGKLILLGRTHARFSADLAGYWSKSPLWERSE